MWTAENRTRYDRSRLRYPSDLTDQEWALISSRLPPAKRGGNKRTVNLREIVNGLMYILSTGCQWRAIRKTCRRARPCTITSIFGVGTALSIASITPSMSSPVKEPSTRPLPPPRSSTARACKALKKGASRSAWLRCGQEDQRQEAAHSRRHARPPDARHRACRGHPRS